MCARTSPASKAAAIHALIVVLLLSLSAHAGAENIQQGGHVPILKIALDCNSLNGAEVTIIGAVSLAFEKQSLCPTREFLEADQLNCLWLAVDETWTADDLMGVQERITPGTYVMVEGRVSCGEKGFGDLYGAALKGITLIVIDATGEVLWTADADPAAQ